MHMADPYWSPDIVAVLEPVCSRGGPVSFKHTRGGVSKDYHSLVLLPDEKLLFKKN